MTDRLRLELAGLFVTLIIDGLPRIDARRRKQLWHAQREPAEGELIEVGGDVLEVEVVLSTPEHEPPVVIAHTVKPSEPAIAARRDHLSGFDGAALINGGRYTIRLPEIGRSPGGNATDETDELALRVEKQIARLDRVMALGERWRDLVAEWRWCVQRFGSSSPAARGVLLELVRSVWGDETITVNAGRYREWLVISRHDTLPRDLVFTWWPSELAALVAALASAPEAK